jgi:large subunit ribosomal protein L22
MAPRKARYTVDTIRGLPVNAALDKLAWSPRRAAPMLRKVLQSAIANAGQDLDVDVNNLYVSDVRADDGPILKRGKPRSRGAWYPILVRYCHLTVEVKEIPEEGIPGKKRRDRSTQKKKGGSKRGRAGKSKAAVEPQEVAEAPVEESASVDVAAEETQVEEPQVESPVDEAAEGGDEAKAEN